MQQTPVVVIVDAYSTARHLAPLFRERGYDCVHVQSVAEIPESMVASFRPEDFTATVVHAGDLAGTVEVLAGYAPVAVVAGMELGVRLADSITQSMGLRTNGTALSAARRDKFTMVETARAAGIPVAGQVLATDWDTLAAWYREVGGSVVLKPLSSAGNDGVFFCDDVEQVRAAFTALAGTRNALGLIDGVVAQEYLVGGEFYVNTVSLDGVHHVCDIWWTERMNVNGVRDVQSSCHLLPRRGADQDLLVEYTFRVLDALGIVNGPAHTELKLTPAGPRLIETGARPCGGDLPVLTRKAIGEGQLEWTVDGAVDPERFMARCHDDYEIDKHVICMHMISPSSGTLVGYPKLAEITAMDSFHEALLRVAPGEEIHRSVGDWTMPMLVHFVHEIQSNVRRDYGTARYLDGDGFYDITDITDGAGFTGAELQEARA